MKLSFEVSLDRLSKLSKTFLALSNLKRLKLLLLLKKLDPSSAAEVHKNAKKDGIYANRETTYRALELLTQTDIVSKRYDEERKELVYFIKNEDKT